MQRAGGQLFFEQRPAGADNYKLFVRDAGIDRVLVDPDGARCRCAGTCRSTGGSLQPDGAHIVYGLSKDGSEDSMLHVLDVADGARSGRADSQHRERAAAVARQRPGFFYNQLTGAVDTPRALSGQPARFHRLGADPRPTRS